MSRVLRRPMFRGGGKIDSRGTGITSGLEDRKGFQNGGIDLGRVQSESEKLFELQKSMGLFDRPERKTLFGLGAPEFLALAQRGFEFVLFLKGDLRKNNLSFLQTRGNPGSY